MQINPSTVCGVIMGAPAKMAERRLHMSNRKSSRTAKSSDRKKTKVKRPLAAGADGPAVLQPPVIVTEQERKHLAEDLAYFCVVCNREHASGSVRHDDIVYAEAEIIKLIGGTK